MKRAALALSALAAATVALAQQTAPQTPRTSTTPQEQTAPPANSGARMHEADQQALMTDCMKKVQAAHPSVAEKDIKAYCDKQMKTYSPPP